MVYTGDVPGSKHHPEPTASLAAQDVLGWGGEPSPRELWSVIPCCSCCFEVTSVPNSLVFLIRVQACSFLGSGEHWSEDARRQAPGWPGFQGWLSITSSVPSVSHGSSVGLLFSPVVRNPTNNGACSLERYEDEMRQRLSLSSWDLACRRLTNTAWPSAGSASPGCYELVESLAFCAAKCLSSAESRK